MSASSQSASVSSANARTPGSSQPLARVAPVRPFYPP